MPTLRDEESRTPRLPAKAPRLHSTLQFSPGWLCSSPVAIPRSSPLAWLPSLPPNNPVPSSFPQDTSAFPLPHPADIQYFPPVPDVCPQDLHAQKLKLPMSGNDYALSVQTAEWKGRKHPPGAVSRGKSRGVGAHRCPHPRLPWGWRRPPCAPGKAQPEKSRSPSPSPPWKKEGWPGAPYLAELPRFYILLLPFVKFQMETSNISRGNQPNIGQCVKSKRMAEL